MKDALQEPWADLCRRWEADGYVSLPPLERTWLNTRRLIDSIQNGGLISYFYNSGADTLADTLDALDYLGAGEIKHQVVRVCDLFRGGVPADGDARNEIIDSWPDDDAGSDIDSLLEEVDDRLMPMMAGLEESLAAFLHRRGLAT